MILQSRATVLDMLQQGGRRMQTQYFGNVPDSNWNDPVWQENNAIRSRTDLERIFPKMSANRMGAIEAYIKEFKLKVTPYTLELVKSGRDGLPNESDPCWKQFFPTTEWLEMDRSRPDCFQVSQTDNWEERPEMPSTCAQHKYTNKVCLRFPNCLGYCTFCFEARQVTAAQAHRPFNQEEWRKTIDYISNHHEIEEVIFSGGDPLAIPNLVLGKYLSDVKAIDHVRFLRFHTRATIHNPMRIDSELTTMLHDFGVNAVILDVAHSQETETPQFEEAVSLLRTSVPFVRAHIPLLRGINDDLVTLRELCLRLYGLGIDPYYLIHSFGMTPTAPYQRVPVKKGIGLMLGLKRHITNGAVPEFIVCPHGGKHTVPLILESSPGFEYTTREDGWPIIEIKNWKGDWVEYLDSP